MTRGLPVVAVLLIVGCGPALRDRQKRDLAACRERNDDIRCASLGSDLLGSGEHVDLGWSVLRRACELNDVLCMTIAQDTLYRHRVHKSVWPKLPQYHRELETLLCERNPRTIYPEHEQCVTEMRSFAETNGAVAAKAAEDDDRKKREDRAMRASIAEFRKRPRSERFANRRAECERTREPDACSRMSFYMAGGDPENEPAKYEAFVRASRRQEATSRYSACMAAYARRLTDEIEPEIKSWTSTCASIAKEKGGITLVLPGPFGLFTPYACSRVGPSESTSDRTRYDPSRAGWVSERVTTTREGYTQCGAKPFDQAARDAAMDAVAAACMASSGAVPPKAPPRRAGQALWDCYGKPQ